MSADDGHDDYGGMDLSQLTDKANTLKSERERKRELIERLQEKLKALNNELASRREESDNIMRELSKQQSWNKANIQAKKMREAAALDTIGDEDASGHKDQDLVRRFLEETLQQKVRKVGVRRSPETGFRVFDEMDLMVEKPLDDQRQENYVDTVLVTYSVPNTELEYKLSYRIDRQTKAKMLREDACNYWGISEVEYVLIMTESNSKVNDDIFVHSVFHEDEKAELKLEQKNPKKVFTNVIPPLEYEAVRAKTGKLAKVKARSRKAGELEGHGAKAETPESFFESLQGVPGLWKFMTLRDLNHQDHLPRLSLRDIFIYSLLLVLNIYTLFRLRPHLEPYIQTEGVYSALAMSRTDPDTDITVPAFTNVSSTDEMWNWLTYTASNELFSNTSRIRTGFYPNSFVEIRMQQVKGDGDLPTESCPADSRSGQRCYDVEYDDESAGKEDLESLRLYWEGGNDSAADGESYMILPGVEGADGRSTAVAPWRFTTHDEGVEMFETRNKKGFFQSYDASGYRALYFLQHRELDDLRLAFQTDMQEFKQRGWSTRRTRLLALELVLYNANFDQWSAVRFLFEISNSGEIVPKADINQYQPSTVEKVENDDWIGVEDMVAQTLSFLIGLYVGSFQVFNEICYDRKQGRSLLRSVCQAVVCWDLFIFICQSILFFIVILYFQTETTEQYARKLVGAFETGMEVAYWYFVVTMLEVVVICMAGLRLLRLLTLSRHVYVIWRALSDAAQALFVFMVVFIPAFIGLVFMAQATFGIEVDEFRTYHLSALSVLGMAKGDLKLSVLAPDGRPWPRTVAVFIGFLMRIFLINAWIGLLVHIFQKTRVRYGYNPWDYRWGAMQWAKWMSWNFFFKLSGWYPLYKAEQENDEDEDEDA